MNEIKSFLPAKIGTTEITRFNALRHGVLSRYTVLPWEDAAEYGDLVASLVAEHAPHGPTEEHLVEELAGILWRKRRLRLAEAAAHRHGLEDALSQSRRTAKRAVVHIDATDGSEDVADAVLFRGTRHRKRVLESGLPPAASLDQARRGPSGAGRGVGTRGNQGSRERFSALKRELFRAWFFWIINTRRTRIYMTSWPIDPGPEASIPARRNAPDAIVTANRFHRFWCRPSRLARSRRRSHAHQTDRSWFIARQISGQLCPRVGDISSTSRAPEPATVLKRRPTLSAARPMTSLRLPSVRG
jgi:hypothetical protein